MCDHDREFISVAVITKRGWLWNFEKLINRWPSIIVDMYVVGGLAKSRAVIGRTCNSHLVNLQIIVSGNFPISAAFFLSRLQ